jgi:hypothetical protein
MKKIRYNDESIAHAMMLANLLAVRYADSLNNNESIDRDDVYRSAIALTTCMGLGQVTMGQIGDIVEDVVRFHSVEAAEARGALREKAAEALTAAERRVRDAQISLDNAVERVARCTEQYNEVCLNEKQTFGLDDFRFMR